MKKKNKYPEKLDFSSTKCETIIKPDEIVYCKAALNSSYVFLKDGTDKKIQVCIKHIVCKLDPTLFFQPHKTYIINLLHVKTHEENGYSRIITLQNGEQLPLSLQRVCKFRRAMRYIEQCHEPL